MYNKEFIDDVYYLIKENDTIISEVDINNNFGLEQKRFEIQYSDVIVHHPAKLEKRKQYLAETKEIFDK